MEGSISSVHPSVPRVEGRTEPSGGGTIMTHSFGDEQPCAVPALGVVGRILVEQDRGDWVDKMRPTVTEETPLLGWSGGGFVPVPFEELEEGGQVKAWASGAIAESYPSQAEAGAIVVEDRGSGRGGS